MNGKLITRHCTNSTSETYHGDQWVTVEIEVRGNKLIKHIIDGKTVLEYNEPQLDDRDAHAKELAAKAGGKHAHRRHDLAAVGEPPDRVPQGGAEEARRLINFAALACGSERGRESLAGKVFHNGIRISAKDSRPPRRTTPAGPSLPARRSAYSRRRLCSSCMACDSRRRRRCGSGGCRWSCWPPGRRPTSSRASCTGWPIPGGASSSPSSVRGSSGRFACTT